MCLFSFNVSRAAMALTIAGPLLIAPPRRAAAQSSDSSRTTSTTSRRDSTSAPAQSLPRVNVHSSTNRRAGYRVTETSRALKLETPLRLTPQSVTAVTGELIADQAMQSLADVVRYVPGVNMSLGEGHRDQVIIRGNSSTADFFVDGVRDDAQYLRDAYNIDRVEALKGANAMTFGRGGGGGVINRVLKEAQWAPTRAMELEGGAFAHKRLTLDVDEGFSARIAGRVTAMLEQSGGFRDAASLARQGFNPTLAWAAGIQTTIRAGYEYFHDQRLVDRGIPSYRGAPLATAPSVFFGNPEVNTATSDVHSVSASIEHRANNGVLLRSKLRFADYDKFYQNTFPGAVSSSGLQVALSAYNHAIDRRNLISQTELAYTQRASTWTHTVLSGVEAGRQFTNQFRNTGYFADGSANGVTSYLVSVAQPTVQTAVSFRQSTTDADNESRATTAAWYAMDQLAWRELVRLVVGARVERFAMRYENHRQPQVLTRTDIMTSPRAGIVVTPHRALSLYASHGVSNLPSTGDQFATLTVTSQTLTPERFVNREIGAKWDPLASLSFTAAAFRLDRSNSAAPDPNDASRTVQTGAQRTTGYEAGITGAITSSWQIAGGWSAQRARVVHTTTSAAAGATVPLVPGVTASLWNKVQVVPRVGVGLGVVQQSGMYAAIDNTVRVPSFTRVDGALFVRASTRIRAQLNVENVQNARYISSAMNNNNIMPGAPRTVRVSVTTNW